MDHNLLGNISTIFFLNLMVLMLPGVNFFLIVKNAIAYNKASAVLTAIGITTAIMLHVCIAYNFSVEISIKYPNFFQIFKYIGAVFILFIAYKILKIRDINQEKITETKLSRNKNKFEHFLEGFTVDLFNPYISLFYFSLFANILSSSSNNGIESSIYCLVIFFITITWFTFVAVAFSHQTIRNFCLNNAKIFFRFLSICFIYSAYKLVS